MQKKIGTEVIDWDKIYVNVPQDKVIIFKDKTKKEVMKITTLKKFQKLMKLVPNINYLINKFI